MKCPFATVMMVLPCLMRLERFQTPMSRLLENVCLVVIPEVTCGFTSGRGTIDMIFTVRKISGKMPRTSGASLSSLH